MEYQKFKEKIDEKKYSSATAEFKRNIKVTKSIWLNNSPEAVLTIIKHKSLGNKFDEQRLYEGLEIKKDTTFISMAVENTGFEIVNSKPNGWTFTSYEVKSQKNGGSKLKVTISFKLANRTRVGLNGELGSLLWKWNNKKLIRELFEWLKKEFPVKHQQQL